MIAGKIGSKSTNLRLCQLVWKNAFERGVIKQNPFQTMSDGHGRVNVVNRFLNGAVNPRTLKPYSASFLDEKIPAVYNGPLRDMIIEQDVSMKNLEPTTRRLSLARMIKKVSMNDDPQQYKIQQQYKNLKKGDITVMRGYAYTAPDIESNSYLSETNPFTSIIFHIDVEEGARLSCNGASEYVFPRYSMFECLSNKKDKRGIHHIRLRYILPDECWRG